VGPALRPILRPGLTLDVVEVGDLPARIVQFRLLTQETSLTQRLTHATTVNSLVTGSGIDLSVGIDRGKKWQRSSPS